MLIKIVFSFRQAAMMIAALSLLLSLNSCSTKSPVEPTPLSSGSAKTEAFAFKTKAPDEISVMTFNVENLFDDVDDPGVNDETYLPLSLKKNAEHKKKCAAVTNRFYQTQCFEQDWNDEVIDAKLGNLAKIILQVEDGTGPDILILQEVENLNILQRLNKEKLQKARYGTIALVPGFDERGINVAVLSRLPLSGKSVIHQIPFAAPHDKMKTRGILEVPLRTLFKRDLVIFVSHFPSQSNPTVTRKNAHEFLLELMNRHPQKMIIAGGDLNTTKKEDAENQYFKNIYSAKYDISHVYGCKSCPGTHNYRGNWDFLDVLIFPKDASARGFEMSAEHIDVLRYQKEFLYKGELPRRFNPEELTGAADHFPLYMKFRELPKTKVSEKAKVPATKRN